MIRFTQYLRPNGRKSDIGIERPADVEELAQSLLAAGCDFEAEVLRTGDVSFEIVRFDDEGEPESLAMEIVPNGPGVPEAVDRLVREAHTAVFS